MPIIPIHIARLEQGKITWLDKNKLSMWLSYIESGIVEVEIRKQGDKRSDRQNRYYWAYLEIIEKETGNNRNDLHELFKQEFLTYEEKEIMGKNIKVYQSTTRITKKDFSDYIDKISSLTGVPCPAAENYNI